MFDSDTRNGTTQDKAPRFAIGEVVNREFKVRSLEEDENGRLLYRCSRLSGDEEVFVRCAGLKKRSGGFWASLLSGRGRDSAETTVNDGQEHVESFDLQYEGNTLIFLVEKRMQAGEQSIDEADPEDPRAPGDPEQRSGPSRTRLLIYKRGDCYLEVDIPAIGFRGVGLYMVFFNVIWFGFLSWWTYSAIASILDTVNAGGIIAALFSLPFWAAGCFVVPLTVRIIFTHENLTITPATFHIKRRLVLKRRHRDSVNNADKAAEELTRLDRRFCAQVSGSTSTLTAASTKESTDSDGGTVRYFALMEGSTEHKLHSHLSDAEREWLVSEINTTVDAIKQRTDVCLQATTEQTNTET